MDISPLDQAPDPGLGRAFQLPREIQDDQTLVALHAEMVERLRREAAGLPMNTLQQLLIERIATRYIIIRHREDNASFVGVNQEKEFNQLYLDSTKEFNRLLKDSDDKLRQALMDEITSLVITASATIKDDEDRREFRRLLSEGLAAIDM